MILTDYLRSEKGPEWDYAKQMGISHAVIRLPEDGRFDVTDQGHWQTLYKRFTDEGLTPLVIEPLPNVLHDHIKLGDEKRDECIEKVIRMLPVLSSLNIRTICFNFMAHIGWLRTSNNIRERGGALVTGFDLDNFQATDDFCITQDQLWHNLKYFLEAVIPHAEQHGIRFALHPDDPPVSKLGGVSRILTNLENITKAVQLVDSSYLGVTLCQATYSAMGENVPEVIRHFSKLDKLFFVHFRDIKGEKYRFRETFHDNGQTNMAEAIRTYLDCEFDGPVRVDHVPSMAGEDNQIPGYASLGRLFAVGYLRGLLEAEQEHRTP